MILQFIKEEERLAVTIREHFRDIAATCIVRNEINGWRKLHDKSEVVYGITQNPYPGPPVMPREFPSGIWNVGKPRRRTDKYLAPYYIPTDAEQYLATWDLDENGGYSKPRGERILDIGYGLHHSTSNTTVGCIRIVYINDIVWLKNVIEEMIERGERVLLKV